MSAHEEARGASEGGGGRSANHCAKPHHFLSLPFVSSPHSYVKTLNKSATANPAGGAAAPSVDAARKAKKKAEEDAKKEAAALFAVAIKQPKLPPGVDPKSVVCEYFRAGVCTKGFKCKYAHDLAVERKTQKIDLFSDRRDEGDEDGEGGATMADWDQATLEAAIAQKHGAEEASSATNANARTTIICKFFLDAVEKRQYGWFWACPNGRDCKYRHALPPGYVLPSQMKELLAAEAAAAPNIEDQIEAERAKVDARTPITADVFKAWRAAQEAAAAEKAGAAAAARAKAGTLTGREIFALDGFVAEDDISAAAGYEREVDDEAEIVRVAAAAAAAEAAARAEAGVGASTAGGAEDGGPTLRAPRPPMPDAAAAAPAAAVPASDAVAAAAADLLADEDDDDDDDLEALEAELAAATV